MRPTSEAIVAGARVWFASFVSKGKGMFEKRHERVLPVGRFAWRMVAFTGLALMLIGLALGIGVFGYHYIAGLSFVDSILNASMILTGMGPVSPLPSTAAKLFASAYAIFSGLVFITVMGVVLTPVVHRLLHWFHVDETAENAKGERDR